MRFLSRIARMWLLLAFLAVGIYFSVFNQDRLHLQLPPLLEHITVPAYMAFCACFLLGAAFVSIFFGLDSLKKSLELRRLKKRVRELEERAQADHPPSRGDL